MCNKKKGVGKGGTQLKYINSQVARQSTLSKQHRALSFIFNFSLWFRLETISTRWTSTFLLDFLLLWQTSTSGSWHIIFFVLGATMLTITVSSVGALTRMIRSLPKPSCSILTRNSFWHCAHNSYRIQFNDAIINNSSSAYTCYTAHINVI